VEWGGGGAGRCGERAVGVDGEECHEKLLRGANVGGEVALRLGKKSVKVKWVR